MKRRYNQMIFIIFFLGFTLTALMCGCMYINNAKVEIIQIDSYKIKNGNFKYDISQSDISQGALIIQGYAFKVGCDTEFFNSSVVLRNMSDDTFVKINTDYKPSYNITLMMDDGHDYENSGFYARVPIKKLEKNTKYQVYILYGGDGSYDLCETDTIIDLQ